MALILVLIILAIVFLYRSIINILILSRKKILIDEHYYVLFMYITFACVLILLFDSAILGYILIGLTPVVDILYYAMTSKRIYWLCCGIDTNLATYGNDLLAFDERYKDGEYFKEHIMLRKVSHKIKITMVGISYEEKKEILTRFKKLAKKHTKKFNVPELVYFFINCAIFLLMLVFLLIQ